MTDFAPSGEQSIRDEHVARYLLDCTRLVSAIEDFGVFETHEAYEAGLNREHERKLLFGNHFA